jgi:hypothetical protein
MCPRDIEPVLPTLKNFVKIVVPSSGRSLRAKPISTHKLTKRFLLIYIFWGGVNGYSTVS